MITAVDILSNKYLPPEEKESLIGFAKRNPISPEKIKTLIHYEGLYRHKIITKRELKKVYHDLGIPFNLRYVIIEKHKKGGFANGKTER